MAQWKKTDSKTKAKVIKEKIKNPDASVRDIEKKVWINKDTVSKVIREDLPEVAKQSDIIKEIIDNDRAILKIWINLTLDKFRQIREEDTSLDLNQVKIINDILDKAKSRVALFGWDITDEQWWLKDSSTLEKLNNL